MAPEPRNVRVPVMMSAADRELIQAAADAARETVSTYLLKAALARAAAEAPPAPPPGAKPAGRVRPRRARR